MKKISFVLLLVFSVLFSASCSVSQSAAEKAAQMLTFPFEYKVTTDEFGFTYKKEAEKAAITVTSPETLSGLYLEKTSSGVSASYDGLVVSLPTAAAEKLFRIDSLVNAFVPAVAEGKFVSESANGQTVITVAASPDSDIVYTVYFDDVNNVISSLEATRNGTKIKYNIIQ